MFDDQQQFAVNPQDPNAAPQGQQQAPIDPYYLEQVRQEVELAHEEFQRLLAGRPRLYSRFRF